MMHRKIKLLFFSTFYALLIFEVIMQLLFLLSPSSFLSVVYNPYCDQSYWVKLGNKSTIENKDFTYHELLTFVNKDTKVKPHQDHSFKINKDIIVYGSSFTGHKIFKSNFNLENEVINYAVPSYGIDQIYYSYILTKHLHPNNEIIIGFLLEDIDRSIFYKRDYEKLKFNKVQDSFKISNTPIDLSKNRYHLDILTFQIFKNIKSLIQTNFNPKKSKCFYDEKKDLLYFFFDEIIREANTLDQNLTFISFNFLEDFDNSSFNWREDLYADYFSSRNITYINSKSIIQKKTESSDIKISNLYSSRDRHLNKDGFNIIIEELQSNIRKR